MTLVGKGRVIIQTKGGVLSKCYVYVPLEVARDSQFPFKASEEVEVSVTGDGISATRSSKSRRRD